MKIIDFSKIHSCADGRYASSLLFEQGTVKIRRIELAAGLEGGRSANEP